MKVFITGYHGFIGRHLRDFFVNQIGSENVIALDFSANSELSDRSKSDLLEFSESSYVIHCADNSNVSKTFDQPLRAFYRGPMTTYNVLEHLRTINFKGRFVYFSSAAVYGNPEMLPVRSSSLLNPVSPYGFLKQQSEIICKQYCNIYGIPVTILRPFSVYGYGLHKQVVFDIIKKGEASDDILLFGNGSESRDFVYIKDLVQIIFELFQSKRNSQFEVYNVGTGVETKIKDLVGLINKIFYNEKKNVGFNNENLDGYPLNWRADVDWYIQNNINIQFNLEKGILDFKNELEIDRWQHFS